MRSFRPNVLPGRYHPVLVARLQVRTHFVSGSPRTDPSMLQTHQPVYVSFAALRPLGCSAMASFHVINGIAPWPISIKRPHLTKPPPPERESKFLIPSGCSGVCTYQSVPLDRFAPFGGVNPGPLGSWPVHILSQLCTTHFLRTKPSHTSLPGT